MSEPNKAATASNNSAQNSTVPSNKSQKKNQNKSYKTVRLERERPKLTRGLNNESNNAPAQVKKRKKKNSGNARLMLVPLGGLDAIGKNMTLLECQNDMIIDDAGLMFPDENHPGIDLILPDYSYVLQNAHKLRAIVITHGHEDHTGCLPYLYKDLDKDIPIYGTKMTLGLIEGKFAEHRIKNARLLEIKPGEKIQCGCISAEFFAVNHSIPGSVGVFFRSPAGTVLHTGDFKLDQTPIDGVHFDFAALSRFAAEGVDVMLSDSTNASIKEFTLSEAEVGKTLKQIISTAKQRVIIAAFASHIHRLQQICDCAISCNRKVVVTGRSMIQNVEIARRLGYLHISDENLIDAYEMKNISPEQLVILCTGSQGEPLSALARIANGEHKTISMDEGDTVIISATPVPGNEKAVTRIINALAKIGVDVYDKSRARVHVSGHAASEELKLILSLVSPEYFMPVHGEAMHLRAHARLAQEVGIKQENIFICENGESLILDSSGLRFGPEVISGEVLVDGLSVGDTSQKVLDERSTLSSQGIVIASLAFDSRTREAKGNIQLELRGVSGEEESYLHDEIKHSLISCLQNNKDISDIFALKKKLRDSLYALLWERTKTRPLLLVNLLEV